MSRFPDGAGAGIGNVASRSGIRLVARTIISAATVLLTSVGFRGDDGGERYGYVEIPAAAPGVAINDDWDALGMRSSGSHSVTFDGVELPAGALRGGFAHKFAGAFQIFFHIGRHRHLHQTDCVFIVFAHIFRIRNY